MKTKREQIIEIPSTAKSESALNDYAKKMKEDFTKPSGIAMGWRACYEWFILALQPEQEEDNPMIVTVLQRVKDIYNKEFFGHPSREEEHKSQEAILFIAKQIDHLHKIRIKSNKP